MQTIEEFVLSGRVVDVMLGLMLLEVVVFRVPRIRAALGQRALPLLFNAGAGVSLMLALRTTLTGGSWLVLAACLLAAGCFHALDVFLRWRSRPAGGGADA